MVVGEIQYRIFLKDGEVQYRIFLKDAEIQYSDIFQASYVNKWINK